MNPVQRTIWHCDRDLEGRKNICLFRCLKNQKTKRELLKGKEEYTKHWFLIISKKETHGFVTVLPITSKEYQVDLNDGEQINDGDIIDSPDSKNTFPFTELTYVLCNKPCRIPIEDFDGQKDYGRLKPEIYDTKIVYNVKRNIILK